MNTHTPGPWKICYDGQIDAADGTRICGLGWDSYREFCEGHNAQNARLIAAAPELLALAEKLRAWLMSDVGESHIEGDMRVYHLDGSKLGVLLDDARAAITRATISP